MTRIARGGARFLRLQSIAALAALGLAIGCSSSTQATAPSHDGADAGGPSPTSSDGGGRGDSNAGDPRADAGARDVGASQDAGPEGTDASPTCTVCPKGCFDLQNDVNNCGSCGYSCGSGPAFTCVAGQCQQACTTNGKPGRMCPQTPVMMVCADLADDPGNCGDCGHTCDTTSGGGCLKGACVQAVTEWEDCATSTCTPSCDALCAAHGKKCVDVGGNGALACFGDTTCCKAFSCATVVPSGFNCDNTKDQPEVSLNCSCTP